MGASHASNATLVTGVKATGDGSAQDWQHDHGSLPPLRGAEPVPESGRTRPPRSRGAARPGRRLRLVGGVGDGDGQLRETVAARHRGPHRRDSGFDLVLSNYWENLPGWDPECISCGLDVYLLTSHRSHSGMNL